MGWGDPGPLEYDEDAFRTTKAIGRGVLAAGAFAGAANPISGQAPYAYRRNKRKRAKNEEVERIKESLRIHAVEAQGDKYLLDNGWTQEDIAKLKVARDEHLDNMRVPRTERAAKAGYPGRFKERTPERNRFISGFNDEIKLSDKARGIGDSTDLDQYSYEPLVGDAENSRPSDNPYYAALLAKRDDGQPGFFEQQFLNIEANQAGLSEEDQNRLKTSLRSYRQGYVGIADRHSDFEYSMESPMVRSHVEFVEAIEDMKLLNEQRVRDGKAPLEFEDILFGHEADILREGILASAMAAIGKGEPIVDARTGESMGEDYLGTAEYYGELFGLLGTAGMLLV